MKKIVLAIALVAGLVGGANATTWMVGGVVFGNVCRNGVYFTVYPISMGQPVGTQCPMRDNYGNIVGYGFVSNE